MEKIEILSKFIQIFPCFANQIQYVDRVPNIYGDTIDIHLVSGDTLRFIVWGKSWKLINLVPISNDLDDYNESGATSGLTE